MHFLHRPFLLAEAPLHRVGRQFGKLLNQHVDRVFAILGRLAVLVLVRRYIIPNLFVDPAAASRLKSVPEHVELVTFGQIGDQLDEPFAELLAGIVAELAIGIDRNLGEQWTIIELGEVGLQLGDDGRMDRKPPQTETRLDALRLGRLSSRTWNTKAPSIISKSFLCVSTISVSRAPL